MTYEYDVGLIGMGTAGKTAARKLKEAGKKIVCFDAGGPGSMCAREGCMPSKSFFSPIDTLYKMNSYKDIAQVSYEIDFDKHMNKVRELRDTDFVYYTEKDRQDIGFIVGRASIIDSHTISCNDETYSVNKIIIATGSSITIPPISGLTETPYWTSKDVFELDSSKLNGKRLAVLGTGIIGSEMAQAFAKLGFSVYMFSRSGKLLKEFPTEMADVVADVFTKDYGISIQSIDEDNITYDSDKEVFNFHKMNIEFDHVLVATGRDQVLPKGLSDLVDIGGMKVVRNEFLETSVDSIYVIGDAGGVQLLHESYNEGEHVAKQIIANEKSSYKTTNLSVAFTYPHIAQVGALNGIIGVADFEFGRATIEREEEGKIIIASDSTGVIVGGSIVHNSSDTMIHIIQEMIGKHINEVGPFYHPTLPEGLENAIADLREKLSEK